MALYELRILINQHKVCKIYFQVIDHNIIGLVWDHV